MLRWLFSSAQRLRDDFKPRFALQQQTGLMLETCNNKLKKLVICMHEFGCEEVIGGICFLKKQEAKNP
jgi:hypothetical protein